MMVYPQGITWSHKMSICLNSHVDFDYSVKLLFSLSIMQLVLFLHHNY